MSSICQNRMNPKFVCQENTPPFLPHFFLLLHALFCSPPDFSSSFPPHSIVSFGAPVSNEYRLVVEGQLPISVQTSQVRALSFGKT